MLGHQSKLYKHSWMSNAMWSTVNYRSSRTTGVQALPTIPFSFYHCWKKSFFALLHCSTRRNSHQNNVPALEVSFLIGEWHGSHNKWCVLLDGVKIIYFKPARVQSTKDRCSSLFPCLARARQWFGRSGSAQGLDSTVDTWWCAYRSLASSAWFWLPV